MMDETQAKDVLAGAAAPPQAKPGQLVDPPEVAKYAQGGDPPMSEWPGRIVGRKDLMMASGDPRDWFRYGHREQAYTEAWEGVRRRPQPPPRPDGKLLLEPDSGARDRRLALCTLPPRTQRLEPEYLL